MILENFEERAAIALEGIEEKTGTFHLDVECPPKGIIGREMTCSITAQIEDPQVVNKEVDFTCYIPVGTVKHSAFNFNQMVTRDPITIERSIIIPDVFKTGKGYTLQCHADYYNLGSRRDSFFDTFIAVVPTDEGTITGEVVGEGEGIFDEEEEEEEEFPAPPRDNFYLYLLATIIGSIILILMIIILMNRKDNIPRHIPHHAYNRNQQIGAILEGILKGVLWLAVIGAIFVGAFYGFKALSNIDLSMEGTSGGPGTFSIILSIIALLATITFMIVIIFRILNIRGEFRVGRDGSSVRYHEDRRASRLQSELNQMILKNEINQEKNKPHYRVLKLKKHSHEK